MSWLLHGGFPSLLQVQLGELIECLDKDYWEADLCAALEEIRDEVHTHMDITEDLTNKARGNNRCFLNFANGNELFSFSFSFRDIISIFFSESETIARCISNGSLTFYGHTQNMRVAANDNFTH